jgi:hypothetical protein
MNLCNWEVIHGFETPREYRRFCAWVSDQISAGMVEEISVIQPSRDLIFGLEEHWYRCKASGEIWRLVTPEFPFRGFWGPVQLCNEQS